MTKTRLLSSERKDLIKKGMRDFRRIFVGQERVRLNIINEPLQFGNDNGYDDRMEFMGETIWMDFQINMSD